MLVDASARSSVLQRLDVALASVRGALAEADAFAMSHLHDPFSEGVAHAQAERVWVDRLFHQVYMCVCVLLLVMSVLSQQHLMLATAHHHASSRRCSRHSPTTLCVFCMTS